MTNGSRVIMIIQSVVIIILLIITVRSCTKKRPMDVEKVNEILSENMSLSKTIDDQGREITTLKAVNSTYETTQAALTNQVEILRKMQTSESIAYATALDDTKRKLDRANSIAQAARAELQRLSTIDNTTTIRVSDTLYVRDTLIQDNTVHLVESYWKDPDGWASIKAKFNTAVPGPLVNYDLMVKNSFSLVELEKDGEKSVQVINENPYTRTDPGTNVFQLTRDPAPADEIITLGIEAGAVGIQPPYLAAGVGYFWPRAHISASAGIDTKIRPIISLRANYSLFKFRIR